MKNKCAAFTMVPIRIVIVRVVGGGGWYNASTDALAALVTQ